MADGLHSQALYLAVASTAFATEFCDRVRRLALGPSGERRTRCLEALERHMSGPLSSSLDTCCLPLLAA
jgi:hypothetical protein